MRAVFNGATIAESDKTILIEGNHYFPKESVDMDHLEESDHTSVCPWKGDANYYHVIAHGDSVENGAWQYKEPKEGSVEKVGEDFTEHIAFWNGVEVVE